MWIYVVYVIVLAVIVTLLSWSTAWEPFSQTSNRVFVAVIASYDLPCYAAMIAMRRKQLEKYNIPHAFILDGPRPEILHHDEMHYPKLHTCDDPHVPPQFANILFKFHAWANGFIRDPLYRDVTHVLRINASTFINVADFFKKVPRLPQIRCQAGLDEMGVIHQGDEPYLSGLAVVYSRDVLTYFANLDLRKEPVACQFYDDEAMGPLLNDRFPYSNPFTVWHIHRDPPPSSPPTFVRVKYPEPSQRDTKDTQAWKQLLEHYDGITF